jgi:hypothetical protein
MSGNPTYQELHLVPGQIGSKDYFRIADHSLAISSFVTPQCIVIRRAIRVC